VSVVSETASLGAYLWRLEIDRPSGGARRSLSELVAVAPRRTDEHLALRLLGRDPARAEAVARTHLRVRTVPWALGLRTKSGKDRGLQIARCGRLRPAEGYESEEHSLVHVWCRDRACPCCQRARARKLSAQLRCAMKVRLQQRPAATLLFVTLTMPKLPHAIAGCRTALDRVFAAYGKLTDTKSMPGREFRRLFPGGVRTIEITYSGEGDVHGSHVVQYDGYHPHLHLLLEVAHGVDAQEAIRWLIARWLDVAVGASAAAQKALPADERRIGQLTKYVTKPLEQASSRPAVARELFEAIKGRRLIHGFGAWKDWKRWVDGDTKVVGPPEKLLLCSVDLGQLFRLTNPGCPPTRIYFERVIDGERITRVRDASQVWDDLEIAERGRRAAAKGLGDAQESTPQQRFLSDAGLNFLAPSDVAPANVAPSNVAPSDVAPLNWSDICGPEIRQRRDAIIDGWEFGEIDSVEVVGAAMDSVATDSVPWGAWLLARSSSRTPTGPRRGVPPYPRATAC